MKRRSFVAVAAVLSLAIATTVAFGATKSASKMTKQVGGGSTGDSLTAAPDTSAAVLITRDVTSWFVAAAADTATRYTVQVSPDGTRWFTLIADSTLSRQAEYTAAQTLTNFYVRVILDTIAGACSFGSAWINTSK